MQLIQASNTRKSEMETNSKQAELITSDKQKVNCCKNAFLLMMIIIVMLLLIPRKSLVSYPLALGPGPTLINVTMKISHDLY